MHGFMWVASRATDIGGGLWRYDYAIQNQTSQRSVGGFSVNFTCAGTQMSSAQHFGLTHHSGSPYSDAPWTMVQTAGAVTWSTDTFAANRAANAIRWGNLHGFQFVSDTPPDTGGTVELHLFTPGPTSTVTATAIVPSVAGFETYCQSTSNSTGSAASIEATGSPILANNDIQFQVSALPARNFGIFLMSQTQDFVQSPSGSQGNLCLGGNFLRFASAIQSSGPQGIVDYTVDNTNLPGGAIFTAGDTWNFQYWTRDYLNPANFSDAVTITFCQ